MQISKQNILLIFPFLAFLSFLTVSPAYSAREVDSYEKLALLRQATGSDDPAPRNGFEARMEATFDTTAADPERSYIAQQDLDTKIEAQNKLAEEASIQSEIRTSVSKPPADSQSGEIKSKDDGKVKTYIDSSEEAFQKNQQLEFEKRAKEEKEKKEKEEEEEKEEAEKAAHDKEKLPPSLANNPFYRKPEAQKKLDPIKKFEANKAVLVSRLVGMGYIPEDAEKMVGQASSPDDLILQLMQSGQSYGDASSLTEIDDELSQ